MSYTVMNTFFLLYAFISFFFFPTIQKEKTITIGPGLQPKAVIDGNGIVKVVYGLENNLYYIESKDKGKSFTTPTLVATLSDGLMLGMGRGPQIASSSTHTIISAVNEKGNIYSWKLNSNSQKWEGPSRINDVDTVAKEGFVAVSKGKGNNMYAVWNDLRSGNNQIYGSFSKDGGLSWSKNKLIYASPDTTICECCKVSIVYDNRDKVYVMWRNQLHGYRDMYLIAIENGLNKISSPIKLGSGSWKLKGCPMDGGNLYSDEKGNIITVWRREGDIYLCEPGKEEIKLGKGKMPVLIKNKLQTKVLWSENDEIVSYSPQSKQTIILGKGRYPYVVSGENFSIAFWETENKELVAKQL
jgi:hypothetical protein